MTLTEFLLARIAEDEAACDPTFDEPDNPGGYGYTFTGHGADLMVMTVDPARVLAECKATRRIVQRCQVILAVDGWEYDDAPTLADDVLSDLAAVYSDHPDYLDEWRPR